MKTDYKKNTRKNSRIKITNTRNQQSERLVVNAEGRMNLETVQHISRNAINATKRDIGQSYAENQVNEHIQKLMRITKLKQV